MRHHTPSTSLLFVVSWTICVVLSPCFAQITFDRTYGGTDSDYGYSVQQTLDSGYIIVGTTRSFGNGADIYLVRTDSLGDTLWTRAYDSGGDDFGQWVEKAQDGGYIIAGGQDSLLYLIKADSLGGVLWESTYNGAGRASCVKQSLEGGYIAVGTVASHIYGVRTDSLGNLIWLRTYGGGLVDEGRSVCESSDGGYAIVGYTFDFSTGCSTDVCLIKVNTDGDSLWGRRYGGLHDDWGHSVQGTADGGYIIAGESRSFSPGGDDDIYVIKTDSLGLAEWSNTFGGDGGDLGRSVDVSSGGGYIVGGLTKSIGAGLFDFYLLRVGALGDSLWATAHGGESDDRGRCVRETSDGGYIIVGTTYSFGAGSYDVYLVKTGEDGEVGIAREDPRIRVRSEDILLQQNTPNPFHHSTLISYSLPPPTHITLSVYDITGRLVETLVNETQQPGIHEVHWNRDSNPSGVYFYRLKTGDFIETKKMVVVE